MNFLKKIFNFTVLFILIVIWLYMDKLFQVPLQTITEIFSVGFPWNLMILTSIVYFVLWAVSGIFKLFKKRKQSRYVRSATYSLR